MKTVSVPTAGEPRSAGDDLLDLVGVKDRGAAGSGLRGAFRSHSPRMVRRVFLSSPRSADLTT